MQPNEREGLEQDKRARGARPSNPLPSLAFLRSGCAVTAALAPHGVRWMCRYDDEAR